MSSAKVPRSPRKLGPGGCLLILLAALMLMILIPVGAYVGWSASAARRVDEQLNALTQENEPTTPAELDAYYQLPAGAKDTTQLWLQGVQELDTPAFGSAAKSLPIVGTSEATIPPAGEAWPEKEAVEKLLADYAPAMASLHQAAREGGAARFPVDFEERFAMLLPHAQSLRGGTRMLQLEAHVRAHHGDAHGVAESIHAMFKLAGSLEQEPIIVSQLVRIACNSMARQLLAEMLEEVEFSADDLEMLRRDVSDADAKTGMRRALMGERALAIGIFQDPSAMADTPDFGGTRPLVAFGARNEDLLLYLEYMGRLVKATKQPWPDALDEADAMSDELRQVVGGSMMSRVRYALTALIMPALDAAFVAGARSDAMSRVTGVVIAIEQYRRLHGKVPESLDQLVPELLPGVPQDPFDGMPLRYIAAKDRYVVYSIGKNRTDDGGATDESLEPDIAVTIQLGSETVEAAKP